MAHVDNLRRYFPAVRQGTYLDTATAGLLPTVSVENIRQLLTWQLEEGPTSDGVAEAVRSIRRRVREHLANLLQVRTESVALTTGFAEAINHVLWGLPLQSGDEVIVTDLEGPDTLAALCTVKQRKQLVIKVLSGTGLGEELSHALERMITPKTRLVICAHVSPVTGQRLPIEKFANITRANGVALLVDGSYGVGAESIQLDGSGIDFYAFTGDKWLSGPDGTGALYLKPQWFSVLEPTFFGESALAADTTVDRGGWCIPAPGAERFQYSRGNLAAWAGWLESLQFLRVNAGWDYVYSRIHGLSGSLMEQLLDLPAVRFVTPRDARAGIVQFQLRDVDVNGLLHQARERGIHISGRAAAGLIQVSPGIYNSDDDIARVVQFIQSNLGLNLGVVTL